MPRNDPRFQTRGWIRKNTKVGPVLNIHVCHHEDRYSIEMQVRSLFQDRTASWVRIVNGVEKYVNETTEHISDEESFRVAAARTRMKSTITLTPVAVPLRVNPGSYDHECHVISKAMIRLLRHDQNILRETDGAVKYEDILGEFNKRKRGKGEISRVLRNGHSMIGFLFLQKGGGAKKRFQYCLNHNSSRHISHFRAIQGLCGGIAVDPELQDNALLPVDFAEYIYHDMHAIIQGGLIPGGKSLKRDRQSVFFTAVNPMYASQDLEEIQYDLDKPRIAVNKNTWII